MTLRFEGTNLIIRDGSGVIKFSSAENLFTVTDFIDSRVVGSVVLPQRTSTATATNAPYINTTTDYPISAVNSAADIVFGMTQATLGGSGVDTSSTSALWRQVNGTNVYTLGASSIQGQPRTDREFGSCLGLFTFFISGGQLFMRDRLVNRAWAPTSGSAQSIVPSVTINFRLYCGTFV